jgi:hypothetical protein
MGDGQISYSGILGIGCGCLALETAIHLLFTYGKVPTMFDAATRMKIVPLTVQTRPTGGGTIRWNLPRSGLLGRIYLIMRGTVAGTLTVPNPLGFASVIRRVRLQVNSGIDLFSVSGAGYHYLLRGMSELESDETPQSNARSAVTAAAFNVDMVIPVQINQRDPVGLVMLQSEQTLVQLEIDFETDANVATGATVTCTVEPYLEVFTVPVSQDDWPPLNVIHSVLEESRVIPGAGDFTYEWPRGNTYLQLIHGCGIGVPGADNFSRVRLRLNQSDNILDAIPRFLDMQRAYSTLLTRVAGTIPFDLVGSSGLGMYDKLRDTINSQMVTDLDTVITASGAGTLYTLRRQLVTLAA